MEMRLSPAVAVAMVMALVLLAGCGSGGDGVAEGPLPPAVGGGESLEIGPMVVGTEKTGNFKAENIFSNWSCSFVALYGAQINYLASTAMLDRVVFVSNRSGHYNIYVVNLDGSGSSLVQLTANNSIEYWPRWSPDGAKIVFTRQWPGGLHRVMVMNADGSDATVLTADTYESLFPVWSPDGGRIAYTSNSSGDLDIWTMYADGSNKMNLTDHTDVDRYTGWSPDGSTLAFSTTRYGGMFEIASVSAYGGAVTRLTNDAYSNYEPAYQPVGASRIAYSSLRQGNNEIFTMSSNGTDQRNFSSNPANDSFPRYSSDAGMITFTSRRADNTDIWIRETNAPNREWQVTKHAAVDIHSDLGSPTVQTERVLIGPNGSDRGGNDPIWNSAPAAIVAFDTEGYRNLVRIGVAPAHLAGMQIKPFENTGWDISGVEVSATAIANLRQDDGWGRPPTLWDFTALNPGMVLMYFHGDTGKLVAVVPVKDAVYSTSAGSEQPAYTSSVQGEGVVLRGDFSAVFDAEGHNLAPNGASSVTLGKNGEVLSFN